MGAPSVAPPPTFTWGVRVYSEDTDSGGVVYYANYLRFMERARTEWLRALGFEQDELRQREGVLFAVSRAEADFKKPALFNDLLDVDVRILRCRRASMELEQHVSRGSELLCRARVRIACVSAQGLRPQPIPPAILTEINRDH